MGYKYWVVLPLIIHDYCQLNGKKKKKSKGLDTPSTHSICEMTVWAKNSPKKC